MLKPTCEEAIARYLELTRLGPSIRCPEEKGEVMTSYDRQRYDIWVGYRDFVQGLMNHFGQSNHGVIDGAAKSRLNRTRYYYAKTFIMGTCPNFMGFS